jgi:hypothetical protein
MNAQCKSPVLWNRCDACGRFIALGDFDKGAVRQLLYPDSECTAETWETLCRTHSRERELRRASGKGEATATRRHNEQ